MQKKTDSKKSCDSSYPSGMPVLDGTLQNVIIVSTFTQITNFYSLLK